MYRELNGHSKSPKFNRTGSQICPSPDLDLLDAVLKNESEKIRRIIKSNRLLLAHIYTPEYMKPILLIACSEDGVNAKTVETLLDLGANPRDFMEDDGWEALHWAAQKTDYDILELLLNRNPGDVNVTAKGNNALHILIRHGKSMSEDFRKCVKLLIEKGINVNCGDSKNISPIVWAAKNNQKDVIKTILDNSVVPVDLDSHQLRGKTARELIVSQSLYDGELPSRINTSSLDEGQILFTYLKQQNEDAFVNYKNGDVGHLVNYDDSNSTLLQFCCEKGLTKGAVHLLDNGADPNRLTRKNQSLPIEIAAENGFFNIFEYLLKNDNSKIPNGLLTSLLKYIDREYHGNYECYKILINKIKKQAETSPDQVSLILNQGDHADNTPLHYAIRYADSEIINELLNLGASLGAKNKYNIMPIQDIEPDALEKHLDECVKFDLKNKKIDKEDFQVTFKYQSLIPPYVRSDLTDAYHDDIEAAKFKATLHRELVAETEVIFYMSKASEFKHLLKHPVIVSFLFMKWLRVQWLFWANLLFYITFVVSLVLYIFTDYAYFSAENKSGIHSFVAQISYYVLWLTLVILFFRELFQIAVAPRNYFANFENYIEIILLVLTGMIVMISSPTHDTRKQLSSLAILLAAFELVLMLGQHPYFSTNVVMLKTVSFNFFKFLIWYSLLIIAFALSFYLLFTTEEIDGDAKKANTTAGDEDENSFNDPGRSIFKTIVMLTGEFDASSINFSTFPVTSKLIFALFIFMIAIILLNLLNGLAVSDTQMIKNDAELVGHIARAQHIWYVESMLVGNIIPVNFYNIVSEYCCCLPLPSSWKLKIGPVLHRDASLLPKCLNYELIIYPNKSGQICLPISEEKSIAMHKGCGPCSAIYLDRDTVRRTNNIVQAKREEKIRSEESQLRKIEGEMAVLKRKLDSILKFLNPGESSVD